MIIKVFILAAAFAACFAGKLIILINELMGVGNQGQKSCREDWYVRTFKDIYIVGCRGLTQPGGLIPFLWR